jgi:hypothetical protein
MHCRRKFPEQDIDEAYKIGKVLVDMIDVQVGMFYDELIIGLLMPKDWDGNDAWSTAEQRFDKLRLFTVRFCCRENGSIR